MQRKWQKVATTAVTGALLASQTLIPVMAAGGTIDADMSTKTPVIRVVVPTALAVSINEFEMGDTSQITSKEFDMTNVSEIPVNVKITSKATLGTNVTLVSKKADAKESTDTTKPAMWLAAVAAVAKNGTTLEYVGGDAADKTVGALAGTEDNVTVFTTGDNGSVAVQDFYLAAATAATYKGIIGSETEDIGNGADYYKLTELTVTGDNAAGVAALAATQDVYIATAAPVAGTPVALTKVAKGTAEGSITWTGSQDKAYSIDAAPTAYATVAADSTNAYLYIDSATTATGDAAAFRYAGALSSAKSGWSTDDLSAIAIQYDITGITTSSYDEMEGLVYGYKAAVEDSKISITATGLMTIEGLTGANYQSGKVTLDGTDYQIGASAGSWTETVTAPAKYQFSTNWTNNIKGKSITVSILLKDGTNITETVEVPAN